MNWLETQLKSWAPRRPSARTERRLFPKQSARREFTRACAWLSPAAAFLFVAMVVARQDSSSADAARPEFAMILSNITSAGFLQNNDAQPENHLSRASFNWTNHGDSGSSIRFMPSTNLTF